MMKRRYLLLPGMILLLGLLFSLVYADTPRLHKKEMADEMGLTDDQVKQMQEIQYNFAKTGIGLRADLKEARLELHHQMAQESTNKNEIAKLVDRVAEARKKVLKHQVDKKLAMKEILTPEQFEKFLHKRGDMKKGKMGKEGKSRRHHTGGMGPQGEGPGI
jgi:Spy/CpxP family protein refolding chaperone